MKDHVLVRSARVKVLTLMEAIKDDLAASRFYIDTFDSSAGTIYAKRSSIARTIIGFDRSVNVTVEVDRRAKQTRTVLDWKGMVRGPMTTFVLLFLISFIIDKYYGLQGALASVLIGLLGALINVSTYGILRIRVLKKVKAALRSRFD